SVRRTPLAGAVLATVPPRRVVQWGLVFLAGTLPLTTVVSSPWQLFAVLAGWGAGLGVVDVGINVEASAVQDRLGRPAMSGFHAAYSVGGLAGAGLGGIAAASGTTARADVLAAGVVALLAGGISARFFSAAQPAHHDAGPSAQRPKVRRWPLWSWVLICLAAMSFGSFLAEGAATDWSAVYLHSSLGAPVGLAAVGFTVFCLTMTGGRLIGDGLAALAGRARLVRLSAGMAAGGFAAALLVGQVWSALAGFALLGVGLSVVVPLVFSAAAATGRPGPNLALVTMSGYAGMLAGPALIGGGGPGGGPHGGPCPRVVPCGAGAAPRRLRPAPRTWPRLTQLDEGPNLRFLPGTGGCALIIGPWGYFPRGPSRCSSVTSRGRRRC